MGFLDKFLNVMRLNPDDDDDFYNEEYDYDEDDLVEMTCPNCGEVVLFDKDILDSDEAIEVICPVCDGVVFDNEELEYTEPVDDKDQDCGCGCGCDSEDK